MVVIATKAEQLDQLARDPFGNRIDVRLDDDRPEEIGTRPLLVPALGVDVFAASSRNDRNSLKGMLLSLRVDIR